jgi:hypothetical protein
MVHRQKNPLTVEELQAAIIATAGLDLADRSTRRQRPVNKRRLSSESYVAARGKRARLAVRPSASRATK